MWKVEKVGELSGELKCNVDIGGRASGASYSLKWRLEVDENRTQELFKEEGVSVSAELELKAESDWSAIKRFTQDGEDAFLMATKIKNNKGLHIHLTEAGGRGEGMDEVEFWCGPEQLSAEGLNKDTGSGFVFTTSMGMTNNKTLVSEGAGNTSVTVSLESCKSEDSDNSITCDFIWQ